jgi:hypothetical protein
MPNQGRAAGRFATSSLAKILIPVRLPPGRAMLVTRPSFAGSSLTMKRIGMLAVAALAANAEAGPPLVAITGTRRRTKSAASCGTDRFDCPPSGIYHHVLALEVAGVLQALVEPAQTLRVPSGDAVLRNPITGIAACCARAATGHAAKEATNSRRRIKRSTLQPKALDPVVHKKKTPGGRRRPGLGFPVQGMWEGSIEAANQPLHAGVMPMIEQSR